MTEEGEPDEAEPAAAPSVRHKRHWWLTLIAVVLVAVVGLGLSWYVAVKRLAVELGGTKVAMLGGNCPELASRVWDRAVAIPAVVPNVAPLGGVAASFRRQMAAPTWGIDVTISDTAGSSRAHSVARDHDRIMFRPSDGTKGVVSNSRILASGRDSSFWVETCRDPSFRLGGASSVRCVLRTDSGGSTTYHFRELPTGSCSSNSPTHVDHEVTVRGTTVTRWVTSLKGLDDTITDQWTIEKTGKVADPWPWQVVPKWFVNLVE